MSDLKATPIIKWAGGKAAIKDLIVSHFPKDFDTYIEPFCGGAAIALGSDYKKVVINDVNTDLINLYQCLKISYVYEKLLIYLDVWQNEKDYLSEGFYYELRDLFKDTSRNLVERAALFIALNKLGFNGLYRVNSKGEFNVPWGKRSKNTKIYDEEKLEAVHKRLQAINIFNKDYCKLNYKSEDFVYLDPPYDILKSAKRLSNLKQTSYRNFTSYNKEVFGRQEQARLAEFCQDLTLKNIKFCQSNADTPYIRELYQNYRIVEIEAPRRISCNGDRTKAKELLIMNYEQE